MNEAGIGFMMSPKYHPAMKIVSPVRKKLKIKTIFNILGPMLNPASVPFAVVGVFHEDLVSYPTNFAYWSSLCRKDYNLFLGILRLFSLITKLKDPKILIGCNCYIFLSILMV